MRICSWTRESTARGFEPLRAEPNGFLVHHLNHSVTLSQAAVGRSPSMHRRAAQKWRASGLRDFALRPTSLDPWRCAHEMHCIARQAMAIRDRVWYAFRVGNIVGVLLRFAIFVSSGALCGEIAKIRVGSADVMPLVCSSERVEKWGE